MGAWTDYEIKSSKKQAFNEWRRIMEYERDIRVLRDYIEETKEQVKKAMENNGKWDWLMSYKIKLEDEIIPELEVTKKDLRQKI